MKLEKALRCFEFEKIKGIIMSQEIMEQQCGFMTKWIFVQYELGRSVSDIAAEIGCSEAVVYARMRVRPETYEEVKKVREEMYCRRLRRVRGLADEMVLDYLERLYVKLAVASDEEKEGLYEKIGELLKISRQYADRVQLAEGKATANIGNAGGLPFKITVTETYETAEDTEDTEKNGTANGHE